MLDSASVNSISSMPSPVYLGIRMNKRECRHGEAKTVMTMTKLHCKVRIKSKLLLYLKRRAQMRDVCVSGMIKCVPVEEGLASEHGSELL